MQFLVVPDGEPSFSEMGTTIEIQDEGAGEFVVVSQNARISCGKISIDPEEWMALRNAIDIMVSHCEGEK